MATAKSKAKTKGPQAAQNERKIYALASLLAERALLGSYLGKSFSGERDIYATLGYKTELSFEDFEARFRRDPLGKRIISASAEECWSEMPDVVETNSKDTAFEKAWKELVQKHALLDAFSAVDRLSGIGEYGVLLLGLNDPNSANLELAAERATDLLFVAAYDQKSAKIAAYELSSSNPRYGKPLLYNLTMSIGDDTKMTRRVHHSRVIHVAEDCLKNKVAGAPRLEGVFNYLQNVELIACGSSEMFWRGAFPGLGFILDKDAADLTDPQKTEFSDEIDSYVHGLKRYMRLKNMTIEEIAVQVADPSNHIAVQIDLISAGTGIPKRILMGSERGELASSQDERHWAKKMQNRQKRFCESTILWPIINRLIEVGVLPKPAKPLEAHWRDLLAPSAKEIAEVGEIRARSLSQVENTRLSGGVSDELVYEKILGMTDEEIEIEQSRLGSLDRDVNDDLTGEGQ